MLSDPSSALEVAYQGGSFTVHGVEYPLPREVFSRAMKSKVGFCVEARVQVDSSFVEAIAKLKFMGKLELVTRTL